MPRVNFTAHLQQHLPCPPTDVAGGTVREVLERIFVGNPRLRSYLLDDQGRLRKYVNIFVTDAAVADRLTLADPVVAGDEIFVFQALSGR